MDQHPVMAVRSALAAIREVLPSECSTEADFESRLTRGNVIAGLLITRFTPVPDPVKYWTPTTTWSATAGYVAGGKAMVEIDAQLTLLEQERYYGLPN